MSDDKLIDAMVVAGYGGSREDALLGLGVDGLDYGRKTMRRVLAVVRAEIEVAKARGDSHLNACMKAEAERDAIRESLIDAAANLAAAASAYRKYARRYAGITPKAETDAFFLTRVGDFDRAVDRANAAFRGAAPQPEESRDA